MSYIRALAATMVIATDIKTEMWNEIIRLCVANDWTVTYKYDNFDAGIDADFVILEKGTEEILFGWDNWFEGEIQCSEERLKQIEEIVQFKFNRGEPTNLKPELVALHRRWKKDNIFNNPGLLDNK
jgi:hypothetical protein